MQCLICNSLNHIANECNSTRAQTVDEAVNHWIHHRWIQLYSSDDYLDSIHFIATSHHFMRLSKGDLLYLNRSVLVDDPSYIRERLIHIFLYNKFDDLYNMYKDDDRFSFRSKKAMRIDIDFWYLLSNSIHTLSKAEEDRQNLLVPQYETILSHANLDDIIDCSICLNERKCKKNAHEYSCAHSFCVQCSNRVLDKMDTCPLCRSTIKTVTEFTL